MFSILCTIFFLLKFCVCGKKIITISTAIPVSLSATLPVAILFRKGKRRKRCFVLLILVWFLFYFFFASVKEKRFYNCHYFFFCVTAYSFSFFMFRQRNQTRKAFCFFIFVLPLFSSSSVCKDHRDFCFFLCRGSCFSSVYEREIGKEKGMFP